MSTASTESNPKGPIAVEPWPSEQPLLVCLLLAAIGVWFALAISIIGMVYAVFIGVALFAGHLLFVTHVRGSAVRLGPDQFPQLYRRVQELAADIGLDPVPEAYLMQAGGSLNALATRFLRSRLIILFSDLLDACGDDTAARDMVIGHELGHHKAGHLSLMWLLAPGWLVPFLGPAYSRAREYTCDRYGAALCGDRRGAARGLAILAAGGRHGPEVNLEAFARQRSHLDTGWMTLGKWLSTYPPLSARVAALEPSLLAGEPASTRGPVRALSLLGCAVGLPVAVGVLVGVVLVPKYQAWLDSLKAAQVEAVGAPGAGIAAADAVDPEVGRAQVEEHFAQLAAVAADHYRRTGALPADVDELYAAWRALRPGVEAPLDPFDGIQYGYSAAGGHYSFWSSGPDGESGTDDDIEVEGEVAADDV